MGRLAFPQSSTNQVPRTTVAPMTVPGRRPQRLGKQIRQEIGALLTTGLQDPRIGFATVTEVRVTPDLKHAIVYISVLGSPPEQEQTLAGFRAATAYVRRELAHRLNVRRVPELAFELDQSAEYGARIEDLLRQVHGEGETTEED